MMKNCPPHKLFHGKGIISDESCHSHKFILRKWFHEVHCALLHCPHAKSILAFEFWKFVKKVNARLHLRYRCPTCNFRKRYSRDIFGVGECHWYTEWKKGNYDVPLNMGLINYLRVLILKHKINHRHVYWEHMPKSEIVLRLMVTTVAFIGFAFWFFKIR
jgi:ribosomal protein L37AE/L43A